MSHCFSYALLPDNCLLPGTDNVHRQISEEGSLSAQLKQQIITVKNQFKTYQQYPITFSMQGFME